MLQWAPEHPFRHHWAARPRHTHTYSNSGHLSSVLFLPTQTWNIFCWYYSPLNSNTQSAFLRACFDIFFPWELVFWMWLLWNTEYVSICKKVAMGLLASAIFFFPPSCSPRGILVSTEKILLRVAVCPKALWWVMVSWAWSPLPGIWKLQEKSGIGHARQVYVGCRIPANWFSCWFFGPLAAAQGHRPEMMPEGNSWEVTWWVLQEWKSLRVWDDMVTNVVCRPVLDGEERAPTQRHHWVPGDRSSGGLETEGTYNCLLQLAAELTIVSSGRWKSTEHFTALLLRLADSGCLGSDWREVQLWMKIWCA